MKKSLKNGCNQIEIPSSGIRFVESLRGRPKLVTDDGFCFTLDFVRASNQYWKCDGGGVATKCSVRIIQRLNSNRFLCQKWNHNHVGDPMKGGGYELAASLKRVATTDENVLPSQVVEEALKSLPRHEAISRRSASSYVQMMRRERRLMKRSSSRVDFSSYHNNKIITNSSLESANMGEGDASQSRGVSETSGNESSTQQTFKVNRQISVCPNISRGCTFQTSGTNRQPRNQMKRHLERECLFLSVRCGDIACNNKSLTLSTVLYHIHGEHLSSDFIHVGKHNFKNHLVVRDDDFCEYETVWTPDHLIWSEVLSHSSNFSVDMSMGKEHFRRTKIDDINVPPSPSRLPQHHHFFRECCRTSQGMWYMWVYMVGHDFQTTQFGAKIEIFSRDGGEKFSYTGRVNTMFHHSEKLPRRDDEEFLELSTTCDEYQTVEKQDQLDSSFSVVNNASTLNFQELCGLQFNDAIVKRLLSLESSADRNVDDESRSKSLRSHVHAPPVSSMSMSNNLTNNSNDEIQKSSCYSKKLYYQIEIYKLKDKFIEEDRAAMAVASSLKNTIVL